ncbi:MAG: hypothetical protein LAT82_05530 [Nanoarchaeota archaeon]|nr:hypothetical protein [Nanoarchaeota archaeon]
MPNLEDLKKKILNLLQIFKNNKDISENEIFTKRSIWYKRGIFNSILLVLKDNKEISLFNNLIDELSQYESNYNSYTREDLKTMLKDLFFELMRNDDSINISKNIDDFFGNFKKLHKLTYLVEVISSFFEDEEEYEFFNSLKIRRLNDTELKILKEDTFIDKNRFFIVFDVESSSRNKGFEKFELEFFKLKGLFYLGFGIQLDFRINCLNFFDNGGRYMIYENDTISIRNISMDNIIFNSVEFSYGIKKHNLLNDKLYLKDLKFGNKKNSISDKILDSFYWFSQYIEEKNITKKILYGTIILELLVKENSDKEGIADKVSRRISFIMSDFKEERIEYFYKIKKIYNNRSNVVHKGEISHNYLYISHLNYIIPTIIYYFLKNNSNFDDNFSDIVKYLDKKIFE